MLEERYRGGATAVKVVVLVDGVHNTSESWVYGTLGWSKGTLGSSESIGTFESSDSSYASSVIS